MKTIKSAVKRGALLVHDAYNRTIDYLRVSVTDRCNFRCIYCMPKEGVAMLRHEDILTYEEILRLVNVFTKAGIRKVRLTGGEPLVRKGLSGFIRNISQNKDIEDISLTTNGSLLFDMASELKSAGLKRVNISLDAIDSEIFKHITGGGVLADTLSGIEQSLTVGLKPVKINVVLTDMINEYSLLHFIEHMHKYPVTIRFIEYMPIANCGVQKGLSIEQVKKTISQATGKIEEITAGEKGAGNGPAEYFKMCAAKGIVGFIAPISNHFCSECNRMRLTADGKLKPCLLSDQEIDVRTALRNGANDELLLELFNTAIRSKPMQHNLCRLSGHESFKRKMSQIGG